MLKNKLKYIICAAMALLLLCLGACAPSDGKGKYEFDDEGKKSKGIVLNDIEEYTVVRGDLCSDEEKKALVTFRETVMKNLGITLPALTDWIGEGQEEREKEILIGKTNRKESIELMQNLGYNDFAIKKIGSKLVIVGGSGTATISAVEYFIENYVDIFQSTLSYPAEGYKYTKDYLISSITIDGTPITEYKLYATDPDINLTTIQTALSDSVAGAYVEIAEEIKQFTKYIIFDRTGLNESRYGTKLEDDGNLYVYGSCHSFNAAVEYFTGPYFEELANAKKTKDIDITWHDDKTLEYNKKQIYSKDSLLSLLKKVYEDRDSIMLGETVSGSQAMPSYTIDNFYEATGKLPAIIGIDLAGYGLQLSSIDALDLSRAVCELVEYAAEGGIITATAHFENPTGNWTLGDKSKGSLGGDEKWQELITEGTELNKKFKEELTLYASFLTVMKENGVPIIWRPLHNMNTDSFWYGISQGESKAKAEQQKQLWIYIYNYFAASGLDNLIWAYSPSAIGDDVLYSYPGDEYVDIVGCSWVTNDKKELTGDKKPYLTLTEGTKKSGAITEFGLASDSPLLANTREEQASRFSGEDIVSLLTSLRSEGYTFSYILLKNGTSSITWLGGGMTLAEDEMILILDETAPLLFGE
ncbi:MAG: hypothetical protein IKK94_00990 [Clostridia bacterium]|nr:hypothetical protein [Clostridia bacterium]